MQQVDAGRYDLMLNETQTSQIIEDVANCESDMGVMYLSRSNEGAVGRLLERHKLEFFELFEAVPHVFVRCGHPLASCESVSLEDLLPYPQLSFVQGSYESAAFSEEPLWAPSAKTVKVSDRGSPLVLCCILMHIPSPAGFTRNSCREALSRRFPFAQVNVCILAMCFRGGLV